MPLTFYCYFALHIMDKKLKVFIRIILLIGCTWGVLSFSSDSANHRDQTERIEADNEPVLTLPSASLVVENEARRLYHDLELEDSGVTYPVFQQAYIGYINLKKSGKAASDVSILSIADFSKSSKTKRLWIMDIQSRKLLLNTWVAHGKASGGDIPTSFSNLPNSHQSSLGFYLTGEVYYGKHGRSLRLDGMDKGFNSRARERAIVIHGADYVSQKAINGLNRLGRSFGCPAVASELSDQVIDWIKNKTVFYIHAEQANYHSVYLDKRKAGRTLLSSLYPHAQTSEQADSTSLLL